MATIEFDGTTVFSESSGEITYHGNFNSSTIFPANQVINTQSYRFSAIMDMNGTSAETTWWSVKFNRLLSNSKLFVNSATPMFQLPNGVWIGNAIKVTCGSTVYRACRGQGNARPNTDTTLMSFLSVFSDSEIKPFQYSGLAELPYGLEGEHTKKIPVLSKIFFGISL